MRMRGVVGHTAGWQLLTSKVRVDLQLNTILSRRIRVSQVKADCPRSDSS